LTLPALGSAIEINTATTRQFLPDADAVTFVTRFDSPLTQAEARFLDDAARHVGKLFLVVNKRDLVSDGDAHGVVESVRDRVREDLGTDGPRLHAALEEFLITSKTRSAAAATTCAPTRSSARHCITSW
jgi:tRNA U34 5-carboxymethylaminomethyl modifying GTPase MnmE/TrmE